MADGEVFIYRTNDGKQLNSNSIKASFNAWEWGIIYFSRDSQHLFAVLGKENEKMDIQIVHLPNIRFKDTGDSK